MVDDQHKHCRISKRKMEKAGYLQPVSFQDLMTFPVFIIISVSLSFPTMLIITMHMYIS